MSAYNAAAWLVDRNVSEGRSDGVAYRVDGEVTDEWPLTQTQVHHTEPVYEQFEGWREDVTGVTRYADLPRAARAYVEAVEKLSGVPVTAVFVGPAREQTLLREPGE